MMKLLINRFIKNKEDVHTPYVREQYGRLTSIVGILNNIILFIGKFIIGTLVKSVSITADAVNNLSDAGSSIISLVSFKLSSKPADEEHPFGHARYEYIASMVVAVFILILGIELIRTSFDKIIHPEAIEFSMISIVILLFSICIKTWMYLYNKKYGKLIQSSVMQATAADSLSDCLSTSAVLISTILSPLIHFNLDGYMGIIVAAFIIITGVKIIKSTLDVLLGSSPSKEFVEEIVSFIKAYDGVLGIHDLMIHDYGPQRCFGSVHVEVSSSVDVFTSHDMIDNIERAIQAKLHIQMVIHMDPIDMEDETTNAMRNYVKDMVVSIDENLSIHDFRMVSGDTHTNLIFDCVVPYHVQMSNTDILAKINQAIAKLDKTYYVVITFDRAYTTDIEL